MGTRWMYLSQNNDPNPDLRWYTKKSRWEAEKSPNNFIQIRHIISATQTFPGNSESRVCVVFRDGNQQKSLYFKPVGIGAQQWVNAITEARNSRFLKWHYHSRRRLFPNEM